MVENAAPLLPLHIALSLQTAEKACAGDDSEECHESVIRLGDAVTYHLGAVAVAQYSQALYTEQIEADPTLNRSLRSLRRVLPGQWLGWAARGLEKTPNGPVVGLREWYNGDDAKPGAGGVTRAYEALRRVMG